MADGPFRIPGKHLERIATIALLGGASDDPDVEGKPRTGADWDQLASAVDPESRRLIRERLRTLTSWDWPDSLKSDPMLRSGHTVRQIFRITTLLALLESHLPPMQAVKIARDNEVGFLRAYASRLHPEALLRNKGRPHDLEGVLVLSGGALSAAMAPDIAPEAEVARVRLVARGRLGELWSARDPDDAEGKPTKAARAAAAPKWLDEPSIGFRQATVIDVAPAGQAVIDWLRHTLGDDATLLDMDVLALMRLTDELQAPNYTPIEAPVGNRYKRRT
ncbi:hypothetical protein [Sphingomonas sp.]|uniref:hypothetical protein n=1 Tax=Sphingomonas sp. TaxID=28214 RepID=UPI002DE3FC92|nr:hypothetical protein [Sphingomonas sp.]